MGSLKKVVKKVAKPEVILPAAALLIGGPMAAKAIAAKGGIGAALTGTAGTGACRNSQQPQARGILYRSNSSLQRQQQVYLEQQEHLHR
jgi:hypothetical protein